MKTFESRNFAYKDLDQILAEVPEVNHLALVFEFTTNKNPLKDNKIWLCELIGKLN